MGRHIRSLALCSAALLAASPVMPHGSFLELKGDDDDPMGVVNKALAALSQKVDDELKKAALGADLKALQDAVAELQKKANRPALPGVPDEEQKQLEAKAFRELLKTGGFGEFKAAVSTIDPEGGYFVLPTIDTTIRNMLLDVSPMRRLASVVSISTATYERFYSSGNRGAQKVFETSTRPQDTARPRLIKNSYGVVEYYAAPAATRHLLEDAAFDVAGWFNTWVANDFAVSEGEDFLIGTGDGLTTGPRGLTTYTRVATADATRAWGEMQYVPGGHASAPTDENWTDALITAVLTLHARFRPGASWLMNTATLIRIKKIKDTNKRMMWSADGHLGESPLGGYLLGFPIEIDENMPDIGENTYPVAFGNFKEGYIVVDRQGTRIVRDEVTVKGTTLFDTYKRVGGALGDSRAIKWIKIATA